MGIGNNTQAMDWKCEGVGINCMKVGENGDVKVHSRSSLVQKQNMTYGWKLNPIFGSTIDKELLQSITDAIPMSLSEEI